MTMFLKPLCVRTLGSLPLVGLVLIGACAIQRSDQAVEDVRTKADDAVQDAPTPEQATPGAPALEWYGPRGWEVPAPRPQGEQGSRRQASLYVDLEGVRMDNLETLNALLGAPPGLDDRSLMIPHERLCHDNLAEAIKRLNPKRLLIRIKGDPTEAQWDCLETLGTAPLYLTACPNDSHPQLYQCDGDANLAALARRPALMARVQGLATSFERPAHWVTIASLPHLKMLLVRGPILKVGMNPADYGALCSIEALSWVDFFDGEHMGHRTALPYWCVTALETYRTTAHFHVVDWPPDIPAAIKDRPCHLRRLDLGALSDEDEQTLMARCPGLEVGTFKKAMEREKLRNKADDD